MFDLFIEIFWEILLIYIKDSANKYAVQLSASYLFTGNDISALGSVPAAVFSFLLCNGNLENFEVMLSLFLLVPDIDQ